VAVWLPRGNRFTVIFDRGGFSAKLFARLIDKGIEVITHRKGRARDMPRAQFEPRRKQRRPKPYDRLMKPRHEAQRDILNGFSEN
jgi:hypothetical protein